MARSFPALAGALIVAAAAHAERPSQAKSDATYAVEGTVESVETTHEEGVDYYLVSIKIAKVLKGDLTARTVLKVSCFQMKKFKPGATGAAGHYSVPSKGDRIKAWANKTELRGGHEALYPNWFEKVDKDGAGKR